MFNNKPTQEELEAIAYKCITNSREKLENRTYTAEQMGPIIEEYVQMLNKRGHTVQNYYLKIYKTFSCQYGESNATIYLLKNPKVTVTVEINRSGRYKATAFAAGTKKQLDLLENLATRYVKLMDEAYEACRKQE
jgi:hypothetical protein